MPGMDPVSQKMRCDRIPDNKSEITIPNVLFNMMVSEPAFLNTTLVWLAAPVMIAERVTGVIVRPADIPAGGVSLSCNGKYRMPCLKIDDLRVSHDDECSRYSQTYHKQDESG
jgi:hypothetical protein